LQGIHLNHILL